MYITLDDGVRLFVDVSGPVLGLDDGEAAEYPSIVMLHGGPGMDHMVFRPSLDALTRVAKIVYIDQRGCGRSDDGPVEGWNLDKWGDDVAQVIQRLGLDKPIVLGTSFGGLVAQRFASQHSDLASGLVLISTTYRPDITATLDRIEKSGGCDARDAAKQFFTDASVPGVVDTYFEKCLPLYTHNEIDMAAIGRVIHRPDVMMNFFGKGGEMFNFHLQKDLERINLPTLILHGEEDPVFPIEIAREMIPFLQMPVETGIDEKVSAANTRFVAIAECGHLSEQDAPERITEEIIKFFSL